LRRVLRVATDSLAELPFVEACGGAPFSFGCVRVQCLSWAASYSRACLGFVCSSSVCFSSWRGLCQCPSLAHTPTTIALATTQACPSSEHAEMRCARRAMPKGESACRQYFDPSLSAVRPESVWRGAGFRLLPPEDLRKRRSP
jgi:hypothetical protein